MFFLVFCAFFARLVQALLASLFCVAVVDDVCNGPARRAQYREAEYRKMIFEARYRQELAQAQRQAANAGQPKKDDKGPNGRYKDAPYHHQNSRGHKSPAPKNGQSALDNSVPIKNTSPNRIGISEGQFVVLNETLPGEFHGHVRAWSELTGKMRQVLMEHGMANAKGKILK